MLYSSLKAVTETLGQIGTAPAACQAPLFRAA